MPLNFTPDERYLVAFYRKGADASNWWIGLAMRLLCGGAFAYGVYKSDEPLLITAFGAMLVYSLYSHLSQPRFMRTTQSAIEKLERRIEELEQHPATDKAPNPA